MEWFNEHRFYLSEAVCTELNEIKEPTKQRLLKESGSSLTPADFKPDPDMNDSYFLE